MTQLASELKLSQRFVVDDEQDLVTIAGFRFTGCVLVDFLTTPSREGEWFRIKDASDGRVTIETKREQGLP